ncbi:MAG TPA: hypothetical protein VN625_03580 [Desulfuromonadaceae bacterium]|nr:hypothetical protein [Desulfuromonadaceae bacterium]
MNSNASVKQAAQSRRRFLSNCSRASLAIALAPMLLSEAQARTRITTARPMWLAAAQHAATQLGYAHFASQVNTSFYVQQYSLNLILVAAVDLLDTTNATLLANRADKDEMFSLTFVGPANAVLPAGTYSFRHKGMGSFQMFIVPTLTPDGVTYEASFNRISQANQLV